MLDMTGEYRIPASRDRVWAALNDPELLRLAIPDCDEIEKSSDTEMIATVTAEAGSVKAKFAGRITLSDIDAPNGCTISGERSGGAAVRLASDGAFTILSYTVQASVDDTARKMADDFFGKFAEIVGAGAAEPEPARPTPETTGRGLPPVVWITGLIVVIGALLWFFAG